MHATAFNRALARAPAPTVVNGLRAIDSGAPNYDGVMREHAAYVRALEDAGVTVDVLPPLADYPDSLFVEDTALTFTGAAILLRPGAPTRACEAREIEPALARHFPRVVHLTEGFVDGGDVLTTSRKIFIGTSARTTPEGARALVASLAGLGLTGETVTTPRDVLHLKSDCALLDDETILATGRLAQSRIFDSFRLITTPPGEEAAANALRINDRVLIGDAYPDRERLAKAGYKLIPLATREIAKIDAGLSCMSLRWRA